MARASSPQTPTRRTGPAPLSLGAQSLSVLGCALLWLPHASLAAAGEPAPTPSKNVAPPQLESCLDCHDASSHKGGLDLSALPFDLQSRQLRDRWTRVFDRVQKGEMPPKPEDLDPADRSLLTASLREQLLRVDSDDVARNGRGPVRRLTRNEFQENLRDLLHLPDLDIRDLLPEDREAFRFTKTSGMLEMSRVQLTAYLDAAEAALQAARVKEKAPPAQIRKRIVGTDLFPGPTTFGNRESMFFARNNTWIDWEPQASKDASHKGQKNAWQEAFKKASTDESLELALFRSASWPYTGYPKGSTAPVSGRYRVRLTARAILQQPGWTYIPAQKPVPMTFRTRKPAGADIINEVRAEGGILDIQPELQTYETILRMRQGEAFEYSLLGLPMPLAKNPNGSAPTYQYPPFPEGGQPGIAVRCVEFEGPIPPESWPPPSHKVLFDELPLGTSPQDPKLEASRLLRRFANRAAREPLSQNALAEFETLIHHQLDDGASFDDALLAGYQAFLVSPHFLYLREPLSPNDPFAVASRLSHFLTESRPDPELLEAARSGQLSDPAVLQQQTRRLLQSPAFERFVRNFTDSWLALRHVRRDDPDVRIFPEYRFDEYLVESLERESREFFSLLLRENLPATALVQSDFVLANDRLAQHYQLPPLSGSALRKVSLPPQSPYGGILTQGAILKVSANGSATSPVIRGAWVTERLLGQPPPPPPPSVPAVEPDIRGAKTIRDLLALHTKSESCAACHAKFDPYGLALENFDVLGGWRARYRGLEEGDAVSGLDRAGHEFRYTLSAAVDASGKLPDGRPFQDIRQLKTLLASDPRSLARNLLHQFTVYATGTPVRFSDRPEIERLLDACAPKGYRTQDLLLALVSSPIFRGPTNSQRTAASHP
jgi:hypothetical protein